MTILESIHESAVDASTDLSTVLRQCRLLAARLDSEPLEEWVVWESDGYPEGVVVPSYRIWPIEVRGNFSGYFQSMATNYPVPSVLLPEEVRDSYEHWQCRMSVAALEATLAKGTDSIHVGTSDLALVLGEHVLENYNCVAAWGEFSPMCLVEALNSVRNRVLEFALALWKEDPTAGETFDRSKSTIGSERATQIFNTVIWGGSVGWIGVASESTVALNVTSGDWESVAKALSDAGLGDDDLLELREALDAEPVPDDAQAFGPKVSAWIAGAVAKAASGAWEIGLGAAGSLLAQVIARYYGLQ